MSRFLIRRLLSSLPVMVGILLITFVIIRGIRGDPCRAILGERATQESCERFNERNGLNKSVPEQFAIYVGRFVTGDLGDPFRLGKPVTEILAERLPVTAELALSALVFATLFGVPLGIISAYRHNSTVDVGTMLGANIGISMPVFWLGLMLSYLFAVILKDTPFVLPPSGRLSPGMNPAPYYEVWGWVKDGEVAPQLWVFLGRFTIANGLITGNWPLFWDAVRHIILPAVTVSTIPLAIIARMTRSSLLEALNQDYVRTARAKGLSERRVVFQHAFRNALLPVVTIIGLSFGLLFSGAVLTETVFSLTGVGRTLFEAITARDYNVVQAVTIVSAFAFVLINLAVDLVYGLLDPRIRLN
ncbi:MAG: ABC transporter permease [Chloroflexi bacterium]|nr:ABC transporter permease [Chloroflexota bacterium]